MKILLTGFEAFGSVEENPTQLIVERMAHSNHLPDHIDLVCEILPVEYEASGQRIGQLIDQHEPDAIVMTGVAASRKKINVEFWARNNRTAKIPDNSGVLLENQPINPDHPIEHFLPATLPVFSIYSRLCASNIPAERSNNAGGYICNNTFYCAVEYLSEIGRDIPAGFIHIPLFDAISQEDMFKAYHEIITMVSEPQSNRLSDSYLYMTPTLENALNQMLETVPNYPNWCLFVRSDGLVLGNVGTKIENLDKRGLMISALDALLERATHDMGNGDFTHALINGEHGSHFILRLNRTYLIALHWEKIDPKTSVNDIVSIVKPKSEYLLSLLPNPTNPR